MKDKTSSILWRALAAPALLLFLGGCASTANTMLGYGHTARSNRATIVRGDAEKSIKAASKMESACSGQDRVLYLEERGRILALCGHLDESIADYQQASDAFEQERMKASVSPENAFFSVASIATNDLSMPYKGYGFEKVMLHNFQAINYLLQDNYDFAQIELNRADVQQEFELERHAKLVAEAEKKQKEKDLPIDDSLQVLNNAQNAVQLAGGAVKNSFQNAFTFYLRGVLQEDRGDYARAEIEYRKAFEIYPNNRYLKRAGLRAGSLNGDASSTLFFGSPDASDIGACPDQHGKLVVVFQEGWIAQRDSLRIPFKWDNAIVQLVLPIYTMSDVNDPMPLVVTGEDWEAQTDLLCNLNTMAVKSLKEIYPAVLTRQALRVIARREVQKQTSGMTSSLLGLAGLLLDRADDRNWSSLPGYIQVAEAFVPAGEQEVSVHYAGSSALAHLDIPDHGTGFVIVTSAGPRLIVQTQDSIRAALQECAASATAGGASSVISTESL